jgi:hypothetical protein
LEAVVSEDQSGAKVFKLRLGIDMELDNLNRRVSRIPEWTAFHGFGNPGEVW